MAITVLFIALALVAITLVVTAFSVTRRTSGEPGPTPDLESSPKVEFDSDISEVRRGDRPDPPATAADPDPDNLSPFYRRDGKDDRR